MKWNFLYQITAASRTPDKGGYRPQIPVLSVLNWIYWTPPQTKFLGTTLGKPTSCVVRHTEFAAELGMCLACFWREVQI